jgi:WD40 repeat protein
MYLHILWSFYRELPVEPNSIQVELAWHQRYPLLAIGAYSEERGGYVRVIDTSLGAGLGLEEALPIPPHPTAQVSGLAWHPLQKLLVVGWENGEIYFYNHDENKCARIEADASHQAAVALIKWSLYGRRLITTDKTGSVIGWKIDPSKQLAVIFHHELKDELRGLVFCSGSASSPTDQENGM